MHARYLRLLWDRTRVSIKGREAMSLSGLIKFGTVERYFVKALDSHNISIKLTSPRFLN